MRFNKIIAIVGCAVLISSCSEFLKSEDKDQMIPQLVEDYMAVLHREGAIRLNNNIYTDFMTDDITERKQSQTSVKNKSKSLYAWQRDIEIDGSDLACPEVNNSWSSSYRLILMSNYILENIDRAIGAESEKAYARGECYFYRAERYFELVNIYAKHYDAATASTDLGVAERMGTGVEERYKRASVARIYEIVEADLLTAITYFEQSGLKKSIWHPSAVAAKLLLSRVHLYKGEWNDCVRLATEVIDKTGGRLWNMSQNTQGTVVNASNPEILFSFTAPSSHIDTSIPKIYADGALASYGASSSLLGVFLPGDVRRAKYLQDGAGYSVTNKWAPSYTSIGAFNYRVAEAYINRAEAYSELGSDGLAVADVSKVVETRVSNMAAVTIPASGDNLKRFIFEERRREFCFEGTRLFDLKRKQRFAPNTITHEFTAVGTSGSATGTVVFSIPKTSPNLVWPIPQEEMDNNADMIQNERVTVSSIDK